MGTKPKLNSCTFGSFITGSLFWFCFEFFIFPFSVPRSSSSFLVPRSPFLIPVPTSPFHVSLSRSPYFPFQGVCNNLHSNPSLGSVLGESSGQVCVITRCNYTLFNEAVNVCCAQNNTKVGFVGVRNSLNHQSRGFLFSLQENCEKLQNLCIY